MRGLKSKSHTDEQHARQLLAHLWEALKTGRWDAAVLSDVLRLVAFYSGKKTVSLGTRCLLFLIGIAYIIIAALR